MDFEAVCRMCMKISDELSSLDGFSEKLQDCFGIYISHEDGLPTKICPTCIEEVERSYRFKQRFEAADTMLRKMLGLDEKPKEVNHKPVIKIEEVEIDARLDYDDARDFEDEYGPVEAIADYSDEDVKYPVEEIEYLNNMNITTNKSNKQRSVVPRFEYGADQDYEDEDDQHKCNECGAVFKNRYSLKRHAFVHSDAIFECDRCDKKYRRKDKLKKHFLNAHPGVTFECNNCSATFKEKSKLKKHLFLKQCSPPADKNTVFLCFVCNRNFKSNAGLIRHSEVHKALALVCAYCEKGFKRKDMLDMHLHTEHGVDLPPVDESGLSCETCGKSFKKMFKLKEHMLTHSDERSFLCNQCGQGFKTKTSLRLHELRHAPEKPFQCEECPKSYYQAKELKQHVSSAHRGEKPYKCAQCEKAYARSDSLLNHMRNHAGDRQYPCEYCGKRFLKRDHLVKHIRIHTGEKPFACPICDQRFNQKYDMIKHARRHKELADRQMTVFKQENESEVATTNAERITATFVGQPTPPITMEHRQ